MNWLSEESDPFFCLLFLFVPKSVYARRVVPRIMIMLPRTIGLITAVTVEPKVYPIVPTPIAMSSNARKNKVINIDLGKIISFEVNLLGWVEGAILSYSYEKVKLERV